MALHARPPLLESLLVRRSINELEAHRDTCADCHRTPLVGEEIHRYEAGPRVGSKHLVCELCRPLRREAPARTERMLPGGHAGTIKLFRAA